MSGCVLCRTAFHREAAGVHPSSLYNFAVLFMLSIHHCGFDSIDRSYHRALHFNAALQGVLFSRFPHRANGEASAVNPCGMRWKRCCGSEGSPPEVKSRWQEGEIRGGQYSSVRTNPSLLLLKWAEYKTSGRYDE